LKRTIRYQAAIIRDDHLLLLKAVDRADGQTFWVIPGGGREPDESEDECVQREVSEETHLHVEVGRLVLDEPVIGNDLYQRAKTYACQIISGEARPGIEPEVDTAEHVTLRDVGWFDLRDSTGWDTLALNDPITYPLLQRLRSALGYTTHTMQDQPIQLPWEQPGWLEQATAWIHAQLATRGWRVTGPVEVLHQRAWATFARVFTDNGTAYFKAPALDSMYEAALTQALARWRPDCTVPLLAVDRDRGWLLSADAGVTLRSASPSADQIGHWLKLLPLYVELQIEMADRVPELLALGMNDRRLAHLPRLYAQLMEATENLRVGLEPGLTPDEYQRLRDLRPQVTAWCEQLAGYGLPETLTHEEVHDGNVLVSGDRYIFTDWSDSSVAHPFFTMLVTIRAAADRLKLAEDGPEMIRLRDVYLEPWTKFETRGKLLAAFELAYRLGMVNRALSWHHGTGSLAKHHKEPYAHCVPSWLQDFLNAGEPVRD
jgi:8-oxo-dGTP pyrophosphatase MutT (NUDIX family)